MEGFYWIDWRKLSDKYQLSLHIFYFNVRDLVRVMEVGVLLGGMIMIYGMFLDEEYLEWFFHILDWIEGCIVMKNDDMREVWSKTSVSNIGYGFRSWISFNRLKKNTYFYC